ncbi:MAG: hypothetical protein EI684_21330 [Candidatus Viridilinea halotolerans]|uniref:Uncharacterized protein n=1 Tax=Candidatus Viridilinea halotolerans TaxID=2491704 RepID=A0A426TRH1_9CHLR|nr:MAG: hypothetical protein EI684_21330 [Candidatus Viridilinea halotolerans]
MSATTTPTEGGSATAERTAATNSTLPATYVLLPRRLLEDLRDSPTAIGVYCLLGRLFLATKQAVTLSPSDIEAYDPAISYGAARRALDRLLNSGYLISQATSGKKFTYLPTWGYVNDEHAPWKLEVKMLGCPRHIQTVRLDDQLLDICMGRLRPHPSHRAIVERYVLTPLLTLRDVGSYGLALIGIASPNASLRGLRMLDAYNRPLPIPSARNILALASQRANGDNALTLAGWQRLGVAVKAPEAFSGEAIFFAPKEMIGTVLDIKIGLHIDKPISKKIKSDGGGVVDHSTDHVADHLIDHLIEPMIAPVIGDVIGRSKPAKAASKPSGRAKTAVINLPPRSHGDHGKVQNNGESTTSTVSAETSRLSNEEARGGGDEENFSDQPHTISYEDWTGPEVPARFTEEPTTSSVTAFDAAFRQASVVDATLPMVEDERLTMADIRTAFAKTNVPAAKEISGTTTTVPSLGTEAVEMATTSADLTLDAAPLLAAPPVQSQQADVPPSEEESAYAPASDDDDDDAESEPLTMAELLAILTKATDANAGTTETGEPVVSQRWANAPLLNDPVIPSFWIEKSPAADKLETPPLRAAAPQASGGSREAFWIEKPPTADEPAAAAPQASECSSAAFGAVAPPAADEAEATPQASGGSRAAFGAAAPPTADEPAAAQPLASERSRAAFGAAAPPAADEAEAAPQTAAPAPVTSSFWLEKPPTDAGLAHSGDDAEREPLTMTELLTALTNTPDANADAAAAAARLLSVITKTEKTPTFGHVLRRFVPGAGATIAAHFDANGMRRERPASPPPYQRASLFIKPTLSATPSMACDPVTTGSGGHELVAGVDPVAAGGAAPRPAMPGGAPVAAGGTTAPRPAMPGGTARSQSGPNQPGATPSAKRLRELGVRSDIAAQLGDRSLLQVDRVIAQAYARPDIRDRAAWVVSALRALPVEGETAETKRLSEQAILFHPALTYEERTHWLGRFRAALPSARPTILEEFYATFPLENHNDNHA